MVIGRALPPRLTVSVGRRSAAVALDSNGRHNRVTARSRADSDSYDVVSQGSMPPTSKNLSTTQLSQISDCINAGAPNS